MDVPKYKLNASVRGVLAQRLLRKVCTGCGIKRPISDKEAIEFNIQKNKLKMEITNLQKFAFAEKKDLNLSFQLIQKKLRDVLASIIKKISKDKKIDFVVLKENIFLINNFDLDLTNEALKEFDKKTSNLKIQLVEKKGK